MVSGSAACELLRSAGARELNLWVGCQTVARDAWRGLRTSAKLKAGVKQPLITGITTHQHITKILVYLCVRSLGLNKTDVI